MKWGRFEVEVISDGTLSLDGGAMFGVVPKVLWNRVLPADEMNRVRLGLNCLLIRAKERNILIDTGCGDKYSPKEVRIYGLESQAGLREGLKKYGVVPEEIDLVINTHLHFDHCGGNILRVGDELRPAFPNAKYVVQAQEYQDANRPHERNRASYLRENWELLDRQARLILLDGDTEVVPGVTCMVTPGHTKGHQSVRLDSEGKTLFFAGDLCPTTAHVPLPWIMAYDLYPMDTLETRRRVFRQAEEQNWMVVFEHDERCPFGYIREESGGYVVVEAAETF